MAPRWTITAVSRLTIDPYKLGIKLGGRASQAWRTAAFRSFPVEKLLPTSWRLSHDQQCSTGLRSGELAGQPGRTLTPLSFSHLVVLLLTWLDAPFLSASSGSKGGHNGSKPTIRHLVIVSWLYLTGTLATAPGGLAKIDRTSHWYMSLASWWVNILGFLLIKIRRCL